MISKTKHMPYRSKDIPMFVSTDPKKLRASKLVGDTSVMGDLQGCRIPSIINAKVPGKQGVLIAAADVGSEGADWGNINLAIRRSYDGGKNWTNPQKIITLQAHHAPQDFEEWQSPFVLDPVMVQGRDGKIIIVIDMFPECKGLRKQDWLENGSGYKEIGGKSYLLLYEGESKLGDNSRASLGCEYTVREQGWVYDEAGNRTSYYMPQHHSAEYEFATIGDLYYAVGEADYLDKEPPLIPDEPCGNQDIYVGNVFMSLDKPEFSRDVPKFVKKRVAGPNQVNYSAYHVVETDPAPLRAVVTQHLWMITSNDYGETWSQPEDITWQVKQMRDEGFLGVGPGVGTVLQYQKETTKNGRIIIPLYNATKQMMRGTVIYSDNQGEHWNRAKGSGFINNFDEIQCIELYDGTVMAFGRQRCKGYTPISLSHDGGETWGEQLETPLTSVCCQKSIITYPIDDGTQLESPFRYPEGMTVGKQYVLSAHPTGESNYPASARSDGTISLGEVLEDQTIKWIAHRKLALEGQYHIEGEEHYSNFFAYSCLCVLNNGHIGILYEPQPTNYLAYAEFNLAFILEENR